MEKSRFEIEVEFHHENKRKTEIKTKLNLIYDLKCKSNARNDPIDCRIQGFSLRDFENKVWCSRCDFPKFSRSISDFKNSLDAEMSLEDAEIKRFPDCGVYAIRFGQKSKNGFSSQTTFQSIGEIGRNRRMRRFILNQWLRLNVDS